MPLTKRCIAEFIGTFWLVFGGCGSAVFAAAFPDATNAIGIGLTGVAFAFGLTVLTMAYAIGHISGCHLNPAVSFGLWAGKRFSGGKDLALYIISQVAGAILASLVLYLILSGKTGFDAVAFRTGSNPFATNGFGEHSPGGYGLFAAFLHEFVLSFMFLMIIMGATDPRAPQGFAPIAIGLGLTLIHLIGIPVTNVSVNPARSTGPALFIGGWAIQQLWLFWVAPIFAGIVAGLTYNALFEDTKSESELNKQESF